LVALALAIIAGSGCGINKSRLATEQLVVSDAVDRAVAAIDFSPLTGQTVFFDSKYLESAKLGPSANIEYVISSLRQQMLAYDCRLQEKMETADYIVEARVGVLATDGHEVTYGVPGSAALGTASVLLSNPMPIPALPELSLGRRNDHAGTAKIGVFAYDRTTREPVWQAGVTKGTSQARDSWLLGMGPFQRRSKDKPKPGLLEFWKNEAPAKSEPVDRFASPLVFRHVDDKEPARNGEIATASHEQPVTQPQPLTPDPAAQPLAPPNIEMPHASTPAQP
jgi:hypothetical protein